jgi:nucleoside-diphosphate-sugar epimerase
LINFDNIDRIYFLAWDVGGAKYLYKQDAQRHQLEWNLSLLSNLMPQIEKSKKPFLFISSQLAEECDTVYGVTKRLGEVWTNLIGGVFIRQWNVYGPKEEGGVRSHVVSDFVEQALKTKEIKMMTTGEERRQFIHIDDVCKAWHCAIESNLKGTHDITSFEWIKIIDIANIIASLTGAKVIPGNIIGSTPITPIRGKVPGWTPTVKLIDGLRKMINDFNN